MAPGRADLRQAIEDLRNDLEGRCLELVRVASGFRLQIQREYAEWMGRLWAERPPRYSRALLETLALIAYRQPITRGEIEDVRGVGVSTSIIKTLMEREWIRVLGHREVPGRPALYGTTRTFLDSFNLNSLDALPPLSELKDIENLHADLFLGDSPLLATVEPPAQGGSVRDEDADREGVEASEDSTAVPCEPSAEAHPLAS